jgi:hypothetical protein
MNLDGYEPGSTLTLTKRSERGGARVWSITRDASTLTLRAGVEASR